ncbi:hypothetical protein [Aeromicrobium sp.]|uniref:hypothetical protein n=1 Tax=Aeromicrobium sp. TaxID=1871063 RepID=UPI002FCA779B
MNHRPPFESWATLPHDLAKGAYLVYGALISIGWDYARPRIARTLTAWGTRLA